MTTQFRIRFHRYNPKSGATRISSPVWHSAEDFRAAFNHAEGMRYGMEQADPDCKFGIADISVHGLRGVECNGGRLFETAEELSARVAADQENSK